MNVRKIIFSVLSMMLVLRPSLVVAFDSWPNVYFDIVKVYNTNGKEGLVACLEKDNVFDVFPWWYRQKNADTLMILGTVELHDDDYGNKRGSYNVNWLVYCDDDGIEQYLFEDYVTMGGPLGVLLGKNLKTIQGAQYYYGNTLVWEPSVTPSGFIRGATNSSINVSCPDGLIYHDGMCQDYDSIKGSCSKGTKALTGNAAAGIQADDPWTTHEYTVHLYAAAAGKKRVLKTGNTADGAVLICRLESDKYMYTNWSKEIWCTSSNDPIQHETAMRLFICDKNVGWVEKPLPWCSNAANIKDKVLTGLNGQKGLSCKDRGVGCRVGFSGSNCAYLYCSGDSQPDLEKKTCLTSQQYGNLTQEQKERVDQEVRRSIGECKNMRSAYEKDVQACENSGGTNGFTWNGPDKQRLETVTVDGVQDLSGEYIVETDEKYWDTAANAMKKKNKLNCSYEKNCVCNAKNTEVESNVRCKCIAEHAWEDRENKKRGCKKIDEAKLRADCANIIRDKGCALDPTLDPCIEPRGEYSCECVSKKYEGYYRLDFNTFECVADSTLAICLPLITKRHAEWENGECKCIDRGSGENIRQYHLINGECLETSESVAERNRRNAAERLDALIDADEQANNAFNRGVSNIQEGSKQIVRDAYDKLNNLQEEADLKQSVWRNKDGKFNTMRLLSDSVAGVALGTVGGVWVHEVLRKNQIESGFEAIGCTVGGETVADFGSVFQIGFK